MTELGKVNRALIGPPIQSAMLDVLAPHGFEPHSNSGARRTNDGIEYGIGLDWTFRPGDPFGAFPSITVVQPEWYRAAREILSIGPDFPVGDWRAYRARPEEAEPFGLGLEFLASLSGPRLNWYIPLPPNPDRVAEVADAIGAATAEHAVPYFERIRNVNRLFDAAAAGTWQPFEPVQVIAGALLAGRTDVADVLLARRGTAVREVIRIGRRPDGRGRGAGSRYTGLEHAACGP